jgi:SDR family mycofactocin-dependent oxidoreductase
MTGRQAAEGGQHMTGRVEGKVAFITGAARGQGRSNALRLAAEGAAIIAVDICDTVEGTPYEGTTPADLDETVTLVEHLGGTIRAARADVRDVDALRAQLDRCVAELGRLDIVNANAGILLPSCPSAELSERAWRDMIDINLTGVWHTTKVAIPHLIAGGRGGSITLTGSAAALQGYPNIAHYVSAKHGLVGLMRSLAIELGPHSIRVNSIHPTQVNTVMTINPSTFRVFRPDLQDPQVEDLIPASQAMHVLPTPWVEPIDISNALVFLASDEARYITGVALPVDAGNLLA